MHTLKRWGCLVSVGYMYILKCSDGSYYTGSTKNIELRFAQHQKGEGANHTKKRLPVTLVYLEEFERIDEAFYREKQIQGWSRKKKEALIEKKFKNLKQLAQCQNETHYVGFDSAQPTESNRTLSEVEGSEVEGSEVEGSEVEGSEVEGSEVEGSEVEGSNGKDEHEIKRR